MKMPSQGQESSAQVATTISTTDRLYAGDLPPPIAVLPIDMLEEIFFQIAVISGPTTGIFNFCSVVISHVCRFWRDVASNSGRLWTTVLLSYPELAKHYVQRSKLAPLTVCLSHRSCGGHAREIGPDDLCMLRPHVMRIHQLILDTITEGLTVFFHTVGREYHNLDLLVLHAHTPPVAPMGFRLDTPRLRTLNLVNLVVEIGDLIALLKAAPSLHLAIFGEVTFATTTAQVINANVPQEPVDLPQACDYRFFKCTAVYSLLNRLRLSTAAFLIIDDLDPLVFTPSLLPATKSWMRLFRHQVLDICLGRIQSTVGEIHSLSCLILQAPTIPAFIQSISSFGELFDWSTITTLRLNDNGTLNNLRNHPPAQKVVELAWPALLQQLPSLIMLWIKYMPLDGVRCALCPETIAPSTPLPCSNLTTICLEEFDLSQTGHDSEAIQHVNCLEILLLEREWAGKPLKRVVLRRCRNYEETVDMLKELVEDVVVE